MSYVYVLPPPVLLTIVLCAITSLVFFMHVCKALSLCPNCMEFMAFDVLASQ